MSAHSLCGAKIVTPDGLRDGTAVAIEDGFIREIGPLDSPSDARMELEGGYLVAGFIDTQVNGGGGVLFNDEPTVETIEAIAQAHRRHGTTGLLPTFISDDLPSMRRAIEAVDAAIAAGVPGILGIHVEGPFISAERRGIHADRFVRAPTEAELDLLARPSRTRDRAPSSTG